MAEKLTPAARLRAGIDESPYSIRSLSKALADRPDVTSSPESIRRALGRWLAGEPIGKGWAMILEDHLGLEGGSLHEMNFSQAISAAARLIRRLEAGERLPRETLLEIAEATEDAAEGAFLYADRLRREAEALC